MMSKRSKRSAFSIENLKKEVREEIDQSGNWQQIIGCIKAVDLNFVDHIPVEVLFCAVLIKFGLKHPFFCS